MKTYFKSNKDWHSKENEFNKDSYPNQDKFDQSRLDELSLKSADGKTPKHIEKKALKADAKLLDNKIKDLLDFTKVDLIDITTHINGQSITGVINYREGGQHKQKRF